MVHSSHNPSRKGKVAPMPDNVCRLPGTTPLSTPTIPETLILLRQRLDLSRTAVGEAIERSTTFMRALESQPRTLEAGDAELLMHVLNVPTTALNKPHIHAHDMGNVFHTTRTPARRAQQVRACANLTADAITELLTWDQVSIQPDDSRKMPHTETSCDAVETADMARARMGLGTGPITHLGDILERFGCLIVPQTPATRCLAAYTLIHPERLNGTPFIFLDTTRPTLEQRFALARELGHLINPFLMEGKRITPNEPDMRLDTFATEFLAPTTSIGDSLDGVTPGRHFESVIAAQNAWGVPALTLLTRARDLGAITERQRVEWADTLRGRVHDLVGEPVSYHVTFHTLKNLMHEIFTSNHSSYALAARLGLWERELEELLPGWGRNERPISDTEPTQHMLHAVV